MSLENKIKKIIIYILVIFFISPAFNQVYADTVDGKIIWVSPYFGFVYIRLNNDQIANLGANLSVYLRTKTKSGKITSITSYKDVTICTIEPPELVREIRKGDNVSGDIKLGKPHAKMKSLI
ncbi:MAG: hypothetical protein HY934_09925, partial [Candidatus Firestonebacteria bacterium]|nr:hypothetical protein [Candidatus Firestonebacteria bacterium]